MTRLDDLIVEPGEYEGRRVFAVGLDWMDEAARSNAPTAVQINQRSDQVFAAVLAQIPTQPAATVTRTGQSTFEYALDNVASETKALAQFADIAKSEFGIIACRRDATTGQELYFEDRHYRATVNTTLVTLDKSMHRLVLPGARADILNAFRIRTFPRRVETGIVIARLDAAMQSPFSVGESRTFSLDYTDPVQRDTRIGAKNQIAPFVFTDYNMNTAADGSGADVSANFTVAATFFASSVKIVVTHVSGATGYIRALQARGDGVLSLNPVVSYERDASSASTYGENLVDLDMPFQSDPYVGADLAQYLKQVYANPLANVREVSFVANQSDALMTAAITGDISARVQLVETVSGLSTATYYFINGVEHSISEREVLTCTWWLTPADPAEYWQLGVAGASELGVTTRLGF